MTKRGGRPAFAPRVLLVEGREEQYVLPELLELAGVTWPVDDPPVYVHQTDGVVNLLDRDSLDTELHASGLLALGIIVDADQDLQVRWNRLRTILTTLRPRFPTTLDRSGVVFDGPPRIGVWLMPDNIREGMLETLLNDLRIGDRALHEHAGEATVRATALGAPFKGVHHDKALLHTWLAWQDPPGQALGTAAKARALDGLAPVLEPFVAWFRRLYQI